MFLLIGAGPASEGTRLSTGGGIRAREYTFATCNNGPSHHRDRDVLAAVEVKYRNPGGGFVAAAGADGAKRVAALEDSGGTEAAGHLSARLGYHGSEGGFELGAVGGSNLIFPGGEVWLGRPDIFFWGTAFSDSAFHSYSLAKFGIGRTTEDLRFTLGASYFPLPGSVDADKPARSWLAIGDIEFRPVTILWLGAAFEVGDLETWTAMFKFSWQIGGTDEPQAQLP